MGATSLIFTKAGLGSASPVTLVFGDSGDDAAPQYAVTAAGRITVGQPHALRVAVAVRLRAAGRITVGMRGAVRVRMDMNVSRPKVSGVRAHMQQGMAARGVVADHWQQAQAAQASVQQIWQQARQVATQVQQLWQQAQRQVCAVRELAQEASAVRGAVVQLFQDGVRLRGHAQEVLQDGMPLRANVLQHWQEGVRLRGQMRSGFELALTRAARLPVRMGQGLPLWAVWDGRFQEARKPGVGKWQRPLPSRPAPCYVPSLPAQLLFSQAYAGSSHLVWICCKDRSEPQPQPAAQYVIPLLRVYMQVHELKAHLLPSMEEVQLLNVSISTDDDSFCWSLNASGPEHLMEQLAPVAGLPARIRVEIDGIPFVFAVMSTPRTRAFAQHRVQVNGVSTTALLADPYMPPKVWSPTAPMTAQQLALNALEYTGVDLDWDIADWLVPAGAYSYQGTPLQAVMRVAASVGAVVRSHRTQDQLIVAPRYPVLPWDWADAPLQVHMPPDVIVTDDLRPEPRAEYNAVYVTGGPVGGVHGHVVRALSARDKLAPQIQDDLLTHADAARMRGGWALAASGNKLMQSITMPVLTGGTNPGILQPGQLLEVPDLDGTWRGLVRSVSVSAAMPKVRQQVTVERVAA